MSIEVDHGANTEVPKIADNGANYKVDITGDSKVNNVIATDDQSTEVRRKRVSGKYQARCDRLLGR